jgi:hypothetical protein
MNTFLNKKVWKFIIYWEYFTFILKINNTTKIEDIYL